MPASITEFATATSTAETITVPAAIEAGDIIVLLDRAHNLAAGGNPTAVVPTGFVSINDQAAVRIRQILSYKPADGTEDSSTLTGMTGTANVMKQLIVFRPNVPPVSLSIGSVVANLQSTDPAGVVTLAGAGSTPMIVLGAYGVEGAGFLIDPRTFSTTKDAEYNTTSANGDLWLAYKIYDNGETPADTTIDMDDEGNLNTIQGCFISAKPWCQMDEFSAASARIIRPPVEIIGY